MMDHLDSEKVRLLLCMPLLILLAPGLSAASRVESIAQEKTSECRTYAARRIEFIGNANTRDRIVRRRIAFAEGKPITEKEIAQTIKNLSSLKRIEKLKREDIEITPVAADPVTNEWRCFADILIHVKETKRR